MPIRASFFSRASDNQPELREFPTFSAMAEAISAFRIAGASQEDKRRVPCICPAEYMPGSVRHDDNVVAIHFGMLDFDGLTEAETSFVLETAAPLESFFYTTHGHAEAQKTGRWKFRLGFALKRPVLPAEWPKVFSGLQQLFRGLCDPKCGNLSRIYFLPCVPDQDALAGSRFEVAGGGGLDIDLLLSSIGDGGGAPPPATSGLRKIGKADLERFAERLGKSRKSEMARRVSKTLYAIAAGDADYAAVGERDEMLFQATEFVADEWPDVDPSSMDGLFAPSIAAMKAQHPDAPDFSDYVSKRDRALRNAAEKIAKKAKEDQDARAALIRIAFLGRRDTPYTDQELDGFARDAECSREAFAKRWILEYAEQCHIFFDGQYLAAPVAKQGLWLSAETLLAPAHTAGVELRTTTDKGSMRALTPAELLERHGTHVRAVEQDFRAQRTRYDMSRGVLVEAPCPMRLLEPERSEAVELWLQGLAGRMYAKLTDWIAAVAMLEEACGALYLSGEKGCGKTTLANGLSRIWTTHGPTTLESLVGGFNDAVLKCPLVFADETVPRELMRTGGSGWMRSRIAATSMTLKRKYLPESTLLGAIRMMYAANDTDLLRTPEILSPDAADALAARLIHVPVDPKAKEVLAFLRNTMPADHEAIIRGDAIAKHALWLRHNHRFERGERFLVEGESSDLQRSLLTSSTVSSSVVEWCLGYLADPAKFDSRKDLLARIEGGKLYVNVKALTQYWGDYIKSDKLYGAQQLADSLMAVSEKVPVTMPGANGRPVDYREIRTDVLKSWGKSKGYATVEAVEDALAKAPPRPPLAPLLEREPGSDDVPF